MELLGIVIVAIVFIVCIAIMIVLHIETNKCIKESDEACNQFTKNIDALVDIKKSIEEQKKQS